MSTTSQGPGWWIASDGRWYPPEEHPGFAAPTDASDRPAASGLFADLPVLDGTATTPGPVRDVQPAPTVPPPQGYPTASGDAPPQGSGPSQGYAPTDGYAPSDGYAPPPAYAPHPGFGMGPPPAAPQLPPAYARPPAYPMQSIQPQPPGPAGPPPAGGRFGRGIRLVRTGFSMVADEPGMLAIPAVAFVVELAVIGLGALAVLPGVTDAPSTTGSQGATFNLWQWLVMVAVGVLVMFVSVVAHATIILRVNARFHGQRVTNRQALRGALAKSPQLFVWAIVNYVVMSILRNLRSRGVIGLILGSLVGVAWTLASFFVVPVILFENVGAIAAVKRSMHLCRERWGENIVGNSAVAVVAFGLVLADVVVAGLLGALFVPLGVVVGLLGLAAILLVVTVASAAFNAALYWFAVTGSSPGPYSAGDLQSAYRPDRRRSGVFGS